MKTFFYWILPILLLACNGNAQDQQETAFPISKTPEQWRAELSPEQYRVLRKKETERAFSSDLNYIEEPGTFRCAACGNPLYRTQNKFDSGTGWPSFDRPISEDRVVYRDQGFQGKEVLCARCGGHLGHVFDDGPKQTTGKRHCINGIALHFLPEDH